MGKVAAPTCSTTMSTPRRSVSRLTSATSSVVVWLIVSSAPSARAAASLSSVDAVAITRAPYSLAIWIAARADARAGRQHQHRLALADLRALDQHLPGGQEGDRQRRQRRVVERDAVARRRHQVLRRHDQVLGVAAPGLLADHPIVGAEVVAPAEARRAAPAGDPRIDQHAIPDGRAGARRDPGAELRHHPADVAARDVRQRNVQRRQAPAQPQIDVVQRRRGDADLHLARAGRRASGTSPISITSGPPCWRNSAARIARPT